MVNRTLVNVALVGLVSLAFAPSAQADKVQKTYLGKLEYQDQTLTKESAKHLHRQILLQRGTQLVSWAIPMMNFTSYTRRSSATPR